MIETLIVQYLHHLFMGLVQITNMSKTSNPLLKIILFLAILVVVFWLGHHSNKSVTVYQSLLYFEAGGNSHGNEEHSFNQLRKYDNSKSNSKLLSSLEDSPKTGGENQPVEVVNPTSINKENLGDRKIHTEGRIISHRGSTFKLTNNYEEVERRPSKIPQEMFILKSDKLPDNSRYNPSVGNGHLGTVIQSLSVFMNGVYNGATTESHRAVIPSMVGMIINSTDSASQVNRSYVLDMGSGVYKEELVSDDFLIHQRVYAHRTLTRLLVLEVEVLKFSDVGSLSLFLVDNKFTESPDITFVKKETSMDGLNYQHGTTNIPERTDSNKTEVHVYYDTIPDTLTVPAEQTSVTWVFLMSVANTGPEALEYYKKGEDALKNGTLFSSHLQEWNDIWSNGLIYAEGNTMLTQTILAGYYYILSSVPRKEDLTWPYVGVSPTGLPTGDTQTDYKGHVFWDQDIWQYPPVLFLHPDFAQNLISNRMRIAPAASAMASDFGYKGLKFPWEAAFTGYETSPSGDCAKYEIHVNGDISQSVMQYFYATNDTRLIPDYAAIVTGIADFWLSRVEYNKTMDLYELKEVLPADEDAGPVNNNVYTSMIAKVSLDNAIYISEKLQIPTDPMWKTVRDKIYIPFDDYLQFHPEYDGYPFIGNGIIVKQADVVLLGYPLNVNLNQTVRKKDLLFYAQVTKDSGPAMTWSIISINWLDLGDIDQGHSYFQRNFNNVQGDFKVWSETNDGGGAVNFLTGTGGFLQNIIAGYGGFRLYRDRLAFNPTLPPNTTSLYYQGIDYLGSQLDFTFDSTDINIEVVKTFPGSSSLCVSSGSLRKYALQLNKSVRIPKGSGFIMPV